MAFALMMEAPLQHTAPALPREEAGRPNLTLLFREHGATVARTLRYLGIFDAEVEDATQEVFIIAHRRFETFDGKAIKSWLRAIAVNVARNHRRARGRRRENFQEEQVDSAVPPSQEEALKRQRMRARLNALLQTLSEEQRTVVVLFEIEQMSMKDIAEQLGCPLQTAYSRLRLGREALKVAWARQTGVSHG